MNHTIKDKVYTKREKEAGRLRKFGKTGAWSVNVKDLSGKVVNHFIYVTEKDKYYISYEKARDVGFFRVLGGELKLIVPIEHWEKENEEVLNGNQSPNQDR